MIHASSLAPNILVIMGSIRAARLNPKVASWVIDIGRPAVPDLDFELVDLTDWPLPMSDEPGIPARGDYMQTHTLAWSRKIAAADGLVFVTPQYNWGYPASLKNAIDHLYAEWRDKPAMIVTYGGHGGGKCAAQLRQVFDAVGIRTVATMPALTLTHSTVIGESTLDPATDFEPHADSVRQAVRELAVALAERTANAPQPPASE